MPSSYKIDLMPSTYTAGVGSIMYERAERHAIVRGVLNNPDHAALDDAINFLIATQGVFHHRSTTLPLQRIRTEKEGPTDVRCVLEYFRRKFTVSGNAYLAAQFRSTRVGSTWYALPGTFDGAGRPNGPINFSGGGGPALEIPAPVPWQWVRAGVTMHVPFIYNSNPIGQVAGRLDTTNSGPIGFGGYSFPINYVLFESVTVNVEVAGAGQAPSYHGSYDFLTVKGGFLFQHAYFSATTRLWTLENLNLYPQSDFLTPPFP